MLRDILSPRVYLVQDNNTLAFQNLAIRHDLAYYNLSKHALKDLPAFVRAGNYRDVVLGNYRREEEELVCQDFYWIERNVGKVRYLAIWSEEAGESKDEVMELQRPAEVEKPKPAEGEEEAGEPAAEGEVKKSAFCVYDYAWTRPGNQKNLSQWFLREKKDAVRSEECGLAELL